jgi:hypothetical protein
MRMDKQLFGRSSEAASPFEVGAFCKEMQQLKEFCLISIMQNLLKF